MKWKVMLCEQFFEVEAPTESDALVEAAITCTPQLTPGDFEVVEKITPESESEL